MMELGDNLRTPSPNKEFRRVSSRSVAKCRTMSPLAETAGSALTADQQEASRLMKLPIGSGAGRFSPSQYLGRSSLSRTTITVSLPASKLDTNVTRDEEGVSERLSKPLMLSQDEIREARRERSMRQFDTHLSTNNLDYIGLKPPAPGSPQKTPQRKPESGHETSLFTEEAAELPVDNGDSPPPPPPPMFSPLSPDELRLLKDSQDRLIASPGQNGQGDQRNTPDAVSRVEEEARLRRFRRIQALQEDYRTSIRNTAKLSGQDNNTPSAVDPAKVLYPLERKGSATVLAVRQTVARNVSQWLTLHSAAAEALDEQIQELGHLRGEHIALQQQLVASEHVLARTGEQNAELLQQLQLAVAEAEGRVGSRVLDGVLQSYPAQWFQPPPIAVPTLSSPGGRTRSGSGDYSASALLSRSRAGTPTRTLSHSGRITGLSDHSTQLTQSRSSTPTTKSIRRYEMYGNDPEPDTAEGPEQDNRSRSGTPARAKVDPKVMPAGDVFSAPWSFQIDPEIRDKQVAATSVGHRFYGPPAMHRRYGDEGQPLGVDCGSTVVSSGGGGPGSRSHSAARSRSGTLASLGGYTFASDYRSSGLASSTGDLSTIATGGRAVRSTSASRMRAAHNERTIQQRASPPVKHGTARSRSTSPAEGRVAGSLQRTQSEADYQRYQGSRLATATRPARPGTARNKMDTLFSAEGQLYQNDEQNQMDDQSGSYGTDQQYQDSDQYIDSLVGRYTSTHTEYQGDYASPDSRRPLQESGAHSSASEVQNLQQQMPQQPLRSPPPNDRSKVLARTPSSSALSPRLKEDQLLAQGGSSRPVDISQARQPSIRRLSNATNSSDASYSGSRYSDIQWDSAGNIARIGHHQPRLHSSSGPAVSSYQASNGAFKSSGGMPLTQNSLTAVSSESDLQGMSLSGAVPWQALDSHSAAAANGAQVPGETGQGALITGSNNRDIAEIWNISSSSSDEELGSLYRTQGGGGGDSGDEEGQQSRRHRLDSVSSDAVEAATQGTARTNRSVRGGGTVIGTSTGHYAMPFNRHANGLRQPEGSLQTAAAPWSGHHSGQLGNTTYPEEANNQASHSYHTDSRQRQYTGAALQSTGPGSPAGVRPRSSSKVLTPSRRTISTPKVRVPLASQSAVTPEAQIQALVARIAVRNEADDYIASLKKSLLK